MLFTAAIMVCLIDQPRSYATCQVINANFKYPNEEMCWAAMNTQVRYQEQNLLKVGYELVDAKCINWLEEKKQKL